MSIKKFENFDYDNAPTSPKGCELNSDESKIVASLVRHAYFNWVASNKPTFSLDEKELDDLTMAMKKMGISDDELNNYEGL
jgi:hypothetical protein